MKLLNINITNYRSYSNLNIDFNPKVNIFIGNNGVGKTNLLESIYFLAFTKSHRTSVEKNVIKINNDFCKVNGTILTKNHEKKYEVILATNGKKVSIDNILYKKVSNYISNLNVILFSPEDLNLIKDSPQVRRKFLNSEISLYDNTYLMYLNEYNNILKTRNDYFKSVNFDKLDRLYLDILDDKLSINAYYIYKYRAHFINILNCELIDIYSKLSFNDTIFIDYITNVKFNNDIDIFKKNYKNLLLKSLRHDVIIGSTTYGPHKDDFDVLLNKCQIKQYGSQGQQRLSVLAIKFAELEVLHKKNNEYPILLLDDMLSELDIDKRNKVLQYLNSDIQVFITTTDLSEINNEIITNYCIYKINDNCIEKI